MSDSEQASYKDSFVQFAQSVKMLVELINKSTNTSDELFNQLLTYENFLETILNWIRIQKNAFRNFETSVEWIDAISTESLENTDELRYRLRVTLIPQLESFSAPV